MAVHKPISCGLDFATVPDLSNCLGAAREAQ